MTEHHLTPKSLYKRFKKRKRPNLKETIKICEDCHGQIHKLYTEKFLGIHLYTLELLRKDPEIIKFTNWVKNKKNRINMKGINKNKHGKN